MRLLVSLVFVLLLAGPAHAAVVTGTSRQEEHHSNESSFRVLVVTLDDPAGAANDLTITRDENTLRIRDAAAELAVRGVGCRRVDSGEVVCEAPALRVGALSSGAGDDTVRNDVIARVDLGSGRDTGSGTWLSGGRGDDVLVGAVLEGGYGDDQLTVQADQRMILGADGGPGADRIAGSPEDDELHGGGGIDQLRGGAGDDQLADDDGVTPDGDVLDGGHGRDVVSYRDHHEGLRIDLPADTAGGDLLPAVEGADGGRAGDVLVGDPGTSYLSGEAGDDLLQGGDGDDRLKGGDGDDHLVGGDGHDELWGSDGDDRLDAGPGDDILGGREADAGDDVMLGGPGSDQLDGDAGADVLDAAEGDDTVHAHDYVRDRVDCGAGGDSALATRGDLLAGCEQRDVVDLDPLLWVDVERRRRLLVADRRGRVTISVDCDDLHIRDCRGSAELWVGGRRVARGAFACPAAGCNLEAKVVLRLPPRVLRRLRGRTVTTHTVIGLGPGLGRGGLPVRERAALRVPPR